MVRYTFLIVLVLLLAVSALGVARASDNRISASIGTLHFVDSVVEAMFGSASSVMLDYRLTEEGASERSLTLGYVHASQNGDFWEADLTIMPVFVSFRRNWAREGKSGRTYTGLGGGFVLTKLDQDFPRPSAPSYDQTDIGWQAFAGIEFADRFFADARYMSGGRELNTGIMLSLGARF